MTSPGMEKLVAILRCLCILPVAQPKEHPERGPLSTFYKGNAHKFAMWTPPPSYSNLYIFYTWSCRLETALVDPKVLCGSCDLSNYSTCWNCVQRPGISSYSIGKPVGYIDLMLKYPPNPVMSPGFQSSSYCAFSL